MHRKFPHPSTPMAYYQLHFVLIRYGNGFSDGGNFACGGRLAGLAVRRHDSEKISEELPERMERRRGDGIPYLYPD